MNWNWSALTIPAFFIFLGLEFAVARRKKLKLFAFEDSVANISIGVAERLLSLFITFSFYDLYKYVHANFALLNIPANFLVWLILLLVTDLIWYWYHRLGHEINILWAAHIVHHQSEEFNYTVSARITIFQAVIRNVFWCVLPFIGFDPAMITSILVIHGAYSFFTHTQVVSKLGFLERILITPSHHRVHHASNEKYLNKNYGDIFIFWDKIFGTYQGEEEKPVYGLTHPIRSYSFLWQHFHYYMELLAATKRKSTWTSKLKVFLDRPESIDQNIRPVLEKRFLPNRKIVNTIGFNSYLVFQLLVSMIALFFTTFLFHYIDLITLLAVTFSILITMVNCGAILEQRRYIYYLEYIRLFILITWVGFYFGSLPVFSVGLIFILLSLSSETVRTWYFRLVYQKRD